MMYSRFGARSISKWSKPKKCSTRRRTRKDQRLTSGDEEGIWIALSQEPFGSRINRQPFYVQISNNPDLSLFSWSDVPDLLNVSIAYNIVTLLRAHNKAVQPRELNYYSCVIDMGTAIWCPYKACDRSTGTSFASIEDLRIHRLHKHGVVKGRRLDLLHETDSQLLDSEPSHDHGGHAVRNQSLMNRNRTQSTSVTEVIETTQTPQGLHRGSQVDTQQELGHQERQAGDYVCSTNSTSMPAPRSHSEHMSPPSCSSCGASGRHNLRIRGSLEDQVSFPNRIKCAIEDHLGASIDWWPLSQSVRPPRPRFVRIEWEYVRNLLYGFMAM